MNFFPADGDEMVFAAGKDFKPLGPAVPAKLIVFPYRHVGETDFVKYFLFFEH